MRRDLEVLLLNDLSKSIMRDARIPVTGNAHDHIAQPDVVFRMRRPASNPNRQTNPDVHEAPEYVLCHTGRTVGSILSARKGRDNNVASLDLTQEVRILVACGLFLWVIGVDFAQGIEDQTRCRQFTLNCTYPRDRVPRRTWRPE